ncbi:hypothetical protein ANN_17569 [Periplaneta americana]|uniref:Uncharacterized protein n=1 Tax=Periplaneta americana TaxID=6978 RepID=A0ABQ8STA9_PERAM|nr:hypothetical protein ANN_17569 [Periplaneta americana]
MQETMERVSSEEEEEKRIDKSSFLMRLKSVLVIMYPASEWNEGDNDSEMSPGSSAESYPAFAVIGLKKTLGKNLNQAFSARNLRLYYPEKSAVAQHSIEKEHKILFDHTKVINKSSHYWDRTIKEAIEIKVEKNNFNRDSGLQLSQAWTPALDQLRPSYNQGHEDHGPRTPTDSNRRNRARRPPNFTQ